MKPALPAGLPAGFRLFGTAAGLKSDGGNDLGVIFSEVPAQAAGVFTRNIFKGAPLIVGAEHLADGQLQAVVVNSKCANVDTGPDGIENARRMCRRVAQNLGISEGLVLPSSTGVIGRPLPIEKIEEALAGLKDGLSASLDGIEAFCRAIMTTDSFPKAVARRVGGVTIYGIAKGAGMIEPNMATMLCYILTDAQIDATAADKYLRAAADKSFNCVSVDTDTSTSDTMVLMANGQAGPVDEKAFQQALDEVSIELAKLVARDGEGATKLITIDCIGALDQAQARHIAKLVVNSPLVKTAIKGADPNWGRFIMAVGKSFDNRLKRDTLKISAVDPKSGRRLALGEGGGTDLAALTELFRQTDVHIEIDLGLGQASIRVWGCDLTDEYVHINADYTT